MSNVVEMPPSGKDSDDDLLSMRGTIKQIVVEIKERVEKLDEGDLSEAQTIIDLCRLIPTACAGLNAVENGIRQEMADIVYQANNK